MAAFGEGINPALGRIDYTPYLQGAAQGSASAAQGMGALGAGVAQGIQQYQKNKQLSAQAISVFEGAASADRSILQELASPEAPKEASKAFQKLQKDGTLGVRDATILAGYVASRDKAKQDSLSRQLQEFQIKSMQEADVNRKASQRAAIETAKSVIPIYQQTLSQLGVSKESLDELNKIGIVLGDASRPEELRANIASQWLEQAKTMVSAQNMAAEAGIRKEGVQAKAQADQRKQFLENMANSVAQGGSIPSFVNNADIATIKQMAAEKVKKGTLVVRSKDEDGKPVQVTTMPGKEPITSPIQSTQPTAEQSMAEAMAKATGTKVAERAQLAIDAIPQYQNTLDNIQQARQAYASGAKSGVGQEAIDRAKGLINTITGNPMFDLARQEVMVKSLSNFAVDAAARLKGQGSITENERKLLAETVAKFGNSEAGNLAVMEFMEAVADREIRKGQYFSELADAGKLKSSSQADFYKNNPLVLPSLQKPAKPDMSGVGEIIGR